MVIWNSFYGEEGDYVEGSTLPVGGHWSEPTAISDRIWLGEFTGARLAVAPNGETLATWSAWQEPERVVEAASGREGKWEEPTMLSQPGAWAVRPAVALDDQGDGVVAWWAANPILPQATAFVAPRPGATSDKGGPALSGSPSQLIKSRVIIRRRALVREGKAYLVLRCLGVSACKGDLRLVARPTGDNDRATRLSARIVDFSVAADREQTIAVPLSRKAQRLFLAAGKKGMGVRLIGDEVEERSLLLKPPIRRLRSH